MARDNYHQEVKRALEKEFSALIEEEVKEIEEHYQLYFN